MTFKNNANFTADVYLRRVSFLFHSVYNIGLQDSRDISWSCITASAHVWPPPLSIVAYKFSEGRSKERLPCVWCLFNYNCRRNPCPCAKRCDAMRCNVAGTATTKSLQLTRTATGDWKADSWELAARRGFFDERGPFCAIILRSIIVKYFTKCVHLYTRIPRMLLPLQIANWPGSHWCHVHVLLSGLS